MQYVCNRTATTVTGQASEKQQVGATSNTGSSGYVPKLQTRLVESQDIVEWKTGKVSQPQGTPGRSLYPGNNGSLHSPQLHSNLPGQGRGGVRDISSV
jgi:hypothetical protein